MCIFVFAAHSTPSTVSGSVSRQHLNFVSTVIVLAWLFACVRIFLTAAIFIHMSVMGVQEISCVRPAGWPSCVAKAFTFGYYALPFLH